MTNSLLITKYVRTILEQDQNLMRMIPIKSVFPIDAKLTTKFPFAVIIRTGMLDNLSKDGIYEDVITLKIIAVSNNYNEVIEIANEMRNWLEGHSYKDDTINIKRFKLSSSGEAYLNDAFIQELDFNVYIQNS